MLATTAYRLSAILAELERVSEQVNAETNDIVGRGDHIELIRHYDQLREANEGVKKARKALDELEDHVSHTDIPDAFKRVGIKFTFVEGVGRVQVSYKWGCSITDGHKPEAFQWLRDGGNGGIIIETINAQTLAAFAKNVVETEGKELPTGLFNTTLRPYTSITKA